jgi:hypothetical protein
MLNTYQNVLIKNHTCLQQHTDALHWAPMVFLISCSLRFCSMTRMLASSFGRMWGWFETMCAVSADHRCLGVSTLVLKTVTDGDVGGPYLLPRAVLQSQLATGLGFSRVTKNSWRFCFSRTTSFTAFLLMLSSKSISSVLQPSQWAKLCWEVMLPCVTGKICYITT